MSGVGSRKAEGKYVCMGEGIVRGCVLGWEVRDGSISRDLSHWQLTLGIFSSASVMGLYLKSGDCENGVTRGHGEKNL